MRKLCVLALTVVVLGGCEDLFPPSRIDLVSVRRTTTDYGTPALDITIENNGVTGGAELVSAHVKALRGRTIVDSGSVVFASFGEIRDGERAVEQLVLFGIKSHSDYQTLTIELSWFGGAEPGAHTATIDDYIPEG